tara:strand:- start:3498 stop:4946 length:1449 start_codon:yes stop_codon:yes gene_type:complete
MMKLFFNILLVTLLAFQSIFSQTGREDRISQDRTRNWQYESICSESGGAESSYLIQVTSYVPDLRLALEQAKKNAVHAVMFKGVAGNNLGCTTKDPLITNSNYESNFDYFEDFFFHSSQYKKYATSPTGSAETSETYKVKSKENYRVTFIISVNVEELRKKLEFDKIIEPLGFAEDVGGVKPSIMIFPSDTWLEKNGYYTLINNQGVNQFVPDYAAALRDDKLNIAIRTLDGMVGERGYPTVRLEEEMKSINQGSSIDNMTEGRYGGVTESAVLDQLLKSAKADIIWKVTWTKESNGIQNWIEYGIDALDAYTNKAFAVEDGSGPKSMSAGEGDLIRQAVTDKMDAFLSEHQTYFNKIVEYGREISLEFRRFDSFEYYFNDDVEFKGREMEFAVLVRSFTGSVSKDRNFSFTSSENEIDIKNLRIEMTEEVEDVFTGDRISQPLDAETFAKKVTRFIKNEFGYPSKVLSFGLGKARITIGEK